MDNRHDGYNLTHLSLGEDRVPPLPDYQPKPPLDVDTRPIDGETLKTWRESTVRAHRPSKRHARHLPASEVAERLGVTYQTWSNWERASAPRIWSAVIREWAAEGLDFKPYQGRAPACQLRAVSQVLGGHQALADALGVPYQRVLDWNRDTSAGSHTAGVPCRNGASALIHLLFESMRLDPVDQIDPVSHLRVMTPGQVREARRRVRRGEAIVEVAEGVDAHVATVRLAVRGETYEHVNEPPVPA